MNATRTALIARLVAAAASAATTFALFTSVVSLSQPQGDHAAVHWAAASTPVVR